MTEALLLLTGLAAGLLAGNERLVRYQRTELNTGRTNEQLLLTRLASRTPAEFHAVTRQAAEAVTDVPNDRRYVHDETGLFSAEVEDEDLS